MCPLRRIFIDFNASADIEIVRRTPRPPPRHPSLLIYEPTRYYVVRPSSSSSRAVEKQAPASNHAYATSSHSDDDEDSSHDSGRPTTKTTTYTKTTYYQSRPSRRSLRVVNKAGVERLEKRIGELENRAFMEDVAEKVRGKLIAGGNGGAGERIGEGGGGKKGVEWEELWEYREGKVEPGHWVVERRPVVREC